MRRRDEWFARCLIDELAHGTPLGEDALAAAALRAYPFGNMHEDTARKAALVRAHRVMQNPDVQARFLELFENEGFYMPDAIAKMIEFIRAGNYKALQDYFRMTQPQPARTSVVAHVDASAFDSREPRAMLARVIETTSLAGGNDVQTTYEAAQESASDAGLDQGQRSARDGAGDRGAAG